MSCIKCIPFIQDQVPPPPHPHKRKRFCGLFMGTYQSDPVLLITRPYDFHLLDCSTGYIIILIF